MRVGRFFLSATEFLRAVGDSICSKNLSSSYRHACRVSSRIASRVFCRIASRVTNAALVSSIALVSNINSPTIPLHTNPSQPTTVVADRLYLIALDPSVFASETAMGRLSLDSARALASW
jgi:hypothetical protein